MSFAFCRREALATTSDGYSQWLRVCCSPVEGVNFRGRGRRHRSLRMTLNVVEHLPDRVQCVLLRDATLCRKCQFELYSVMRKAHGEWGCAEEGIGHATRFRNHMAIVGFSSDFSEFTNSYIFHQRTKYPVWLPFGLLCPLQRAFGQKS